MERDPSREKTQRLIPLSQIVYFQLSENKFPFAEYFLGVLACTEETLGADMHGFSHFRKPVIIIQHATERMSTTSTARVQPSPQLGVNPIES